MAELKTKFRQAQIKAAIKVNTSLLEFYWELGSDIVEKQKKAKWGSGFLKQISKDLMSEFPDVKGFSLRNLKYIRQWYLFYFQENVIGQQAAAQLAKQSLPQLFQIPWWHNVVIISKCNSVEESLFYVNKTVENGWSRSVLTHQIESKLYERQGKAITNFAVTLPKPQSDLAGQLIKDPYNFDFLTLTEDYNERELERALLDHITKFLLELGSGFAFVGKQKALQVGERDFFIDLLFYHTIMHCFIVVELKTVDFEPEFAGKLNFYVKAVDEQIKTGNDKPTIGILICKSKDKTVVEYALSDIYKPMGVSEYQLIQTLPEELKANLPSIEQIEAEFEKVENDEKEL
ncbi:MAG: DUF1016 domain-containing protein [Calditrichaeota bacterium]|nr:DUF1016 domain-containing protein [Calditrichota bacterium]